MSRVVRTKMTAAALALGACLVGPGCSSNEPAPTDQGKMGGGMDSGKMQGGAMDPGKAQGGSMGSGEMKGGDMAPGKMEPGKLAPEGK